MKIKEIRDKDTNNLKQELAERRQHLFDLRSQAVTEKLEDPSQLDKTRKDIARILTILNQREAEEKRQAAQKEKEKAQSQPAQEAAIK